MAAGGRKSPRRVWLSKKGARRDVAPRVDQAYPISTNGLSFDVGATTAEFDAHPLFAIWSDGGAGYGSAFTGNVGGTEYWNIQGSAAVSAAPGTEPATRAKFGHGVRGLAFGGFRQRKNRLATI